MEINILKLFSDLSRLLFRQRRIWFSNAFADITVGDRRQDATGPVLCSSSLYSFLSLGEDTQYQTAKAF